MTHPVSSAPPWPYRLLSALLVPLVLGRVLWRARREPAYGQRWWQRLGYYGLDVPPLQDAVWIHAVSLGEMRAAAILLQALRARWPQVRVVLTHSTATGWEEGQRWCREGDVQVWLPWDSAGACQRFVRRFRPRVGLLVETEVWPNLVHAAHAAGVPLWLINARLSERSQARAQRWPALARQAYGGLHAVWAQTAADAARLQRLGASVTGVMGNLKFDLDPSASLLARGRAWRARLADDRPIAVLASSRDGEEELWLRTVTAQGAAAAVRWLIVPRHPQRFDAVARMLQAAGCTVARRSHWPATGDAQSWAAVRAADVWLGDTLGEMPAYYALADWALMGGSFLPYGGQNLIEAIACGCPVILGPHTFNFQEATRAAVEAQVAVQVDGMAAAVREALRWRDDPAWPRDARARAPAWLAQHRGAAQRLVQALEPWLSRPPHAAGGSSGAVSAPATAR
ncbi:3-deoxy-D-manno-octulosonic acid transferase [Tepidimonas thermarum]|uniref:3-deoxy-D-manno-octulosonic acid transferase n=1 Tax=Tepidimonas thermarum TaxID=335431 RepID=A0A554X4Y4_9BURK|nr:3-deoxy-D-manno-octulosonic acid transferase [Tepidimonas thermarum]TSE30892.1 3-deoxy-D-manno-octulosonic acid transferase [Tepidimonas thermarum]